MIGARPLSAGDRLVVAGTTEDVEKPLQNAMGREALLDARADRAPR